jgi:copper chaperone
VRNGDQRELSSPFSESACTGAPAHAASPGYRSHRGAGATDTLTGMSQNVIAVTGMTCSHCANAVSSEIGKIAGVSAVQVDVGAGKVTITADPQPDQNSLRDAVEAAGYELTA